MTFWTIFIIYMQVNDVKIESLVQYLANALNTELPGMESHRKMIPSFPDNVPEYFNYDQKLREAAVLIVLEVTNYSINTVLIERVPDAGPHSGQIAFPGGRKEDDDIDLFETALREAKEEVGIELNRENCLGTLTSVQIPISKYCVEPVICYTDKISDLVKCEDEVNNIFVVDLLELLETEAIRAVQARGIVIKAPSFKFENQIVWGATAMVLKELKDIFRTFLNS